MSRSYYLRAVLLVVLAGAFAIRGDARGKNDTTYDGRVEFAPQLLHLDDGCVSLNGSVQSGSFFNDLQRINVGDGLQYRKGGKVVTEYPESLTTSIHIAGDRCAPALSNLPSSIFRGGSYSLRFQVEWKDGMQLRPAALSPVEAHCMGYSSIALPSGERIPSISCQLTVRSQGVALNDHLIVSIYSADGRRLTRLSARP
jgi:hypothetical protein